MLIFILIKQVVIYYNSKPNTMYSSRIFNKINSIIDVTYFGKFIVLLLIFYYGNLAYVAIIDPQGLVYSGFLDHHLNYINWLRNSYLYTSNVLAHSIGIDSHISLPYKLVTPKASVTTVYDCLGIGIFCFWNAFVLANQDTLARKIKWWMSGLVSIWIINNIRMTLLLLAVDKGMNYNAFMNHHDLYNLVAYGIIALFIYLYTVKYNQGTANLHGQPNYTT